MATIFNPRTGRFRRTGLVRLASFALGLAAIQAFARSLVEDDEGGNPIDQLGPFILDHNLALPFGEGVIRVPLAWGMMRVANGMARAMIGAGTNDVTPGEALGRFGGSMIPVFSPLDNVDISWTDRPIQAFFTTFSPTWMRPMVAVGMNMSTFGAPITFDRWEQTDQFRSEQFGKNIPEIYNDIARFMRRTFGTDFSGEEVRSLIKGYSVGSLRMLLNGAIENPHRKEMGLETDNALIHQVYSGWSQYAIIGQLHDALEDVQRISKRINAGDITESDLTAEERQLLAWRRAWEQKDNDLRKEMRRINAQPFTPEVKSQRRRDNKKRRYQEQTLAVYNYRRILGKPAQRVNVPKAWLEP